MEKNFEVKKEVLADGTEKATVVFQEKPSKTKKSKPSSSNPNDK